MLILLPWRVVVCVCISVPHCPGLESGWVCDHSLIGTVHTDLRSGLIKGDAPSACPHSVRKARPLEEALSRSILADSPSWGPSHAQEQPAIRREWKSRPGNPCPNRLAAATQGTLSDNLSWAPSTNPRTGRDNKWWCLFLSFLFLFLIEL